MARTISPELLAAQQGNYPPYINLVFHNKAEDDTVDLSLATDATNRIIHIEHHELMYDDYAFIILRNNDLSIPDLRGWWVEIGYGADTSDFGGSGNEYAQTPRLWVTNQQSVSSPGTVKTILTLEGMWRRLARKLLLLAGNPPDFFFDSALFSTYYDVLKYIFETEMGYTLDPIGDQDDFMLNSLGIFYFLQMNIEYREYGLDIIQRALSLTQSYLRAKKNLTFEVRYPQTSDAVDATYYSDQVPYFHEYIESESVLVPNRFIVYANQGEDGSWDNILTADTNQDYVGENEEEVIDVRELAYVTNQAVLDLYLLAWVGRIQARRVSGRMIIRHDCRIELHDKIRILDSRGA